MNDTIALVINMTEQEWKKLIGLRIMQRRKQLNITQSELAEQLEISDSQVSNLERGKHFPKPANIVKLCNALSCNADYFFSGILKNSISENIVDLLASLSIEEQRVVLLLIDCYVHRNNANKD